MRPLCPMPASWSSNRASWESMEVPLTISTTFSLLTQPTPRVSKRRKISSDMPCFSLAGEHSIATTKSEYCTRPSPSTSSAANISTNNSSSRVGWPRKPCLKSSRQSLPILDLSMPRKTPSSSSRESRELGGSAQAAIEQHARHNFEASRKFDSCRTIEPCIASGEELQVPCTIHLCSSAVRAVRRAPGTVVSKPRMNSMLSAESIANRFELNFLEKSPA
mmetsp:Transcript_5391/g.9730  ORF Transcript_5391/g.9730 Transcript_5391/m.9730 type:complete len:220 (+) Transcript_5391:264-923(+)